MRSAPILDGSKLQEAIKAVPKDVEEALLKAEED
jgi:hypothetical protein